jgi:hypothetical protein
VRFDAGDINLYRYCGNDPVNHTDPSGMWVETVWDAANAGMGWVSARENWKAGNLGAAIVDGIGATVDSAAVVIPVFPGGASSLIKAFRAGDKAADALKAVDKSADAAKTIDRANEAAKSELHRPYIRKDVKAEVDARAPRTADGRPIDPNTLQPIDGKPDLGHKTGHEFRTEKAKAEAEGLNQKQFNDRMNNPDLYQLEDPSSNRSRRYEKK